MLQYEYTRQALKNGLKIEQQLGVNPFKFGLVGSTDSHTSLSTAEEDNFFGKHSGVEPNPHRYEHVVMDFQGRKLMSWEMAASGYAGVWATENTREALWDAMKRKEVYATTGPRMVVRFFGGFDFVPKDAVSRLPAEVGYAKGVPMGGDLAPGARRQGADVPRRGAEGPDGRQPRPHPDRQGLAGREGRDAGEGLRRRLGRRGDAQARRERQAARRSATPWTCKEATWTNTIGDPELIAVWKDPDFDPSLRAFYYVRVIEIPTPRWTAYDAKRFGVSRCRRKCRW